MFVYNIYDTYAHVHIYATKTADNMCFLGLWSQEKLIFIVCLILESHLALYHKYWLFLNIFSNFYEYHNYIYYNFVSNDDRCLSYIIIQEVWYFTSSLLTLLLLFPLLFFSLSSCLFVKSCLTLCNPMDCSMLACLVLSVGVCSNTCPLNRWCHPTI